MLLVEVEASNCEALQKDPQKLIETFNGFSFNQYISRFNKELEPEKKLHMKEVFF